VTRWSLESAAAPLFQQSAFTPEFVARLERFFHEQPRDFLCDHLDCYCDGEMMFWFHDAFAGGDMALNRKIKRASIQAFGRQLGPQCALEGPIV
jgi:hypothetical protein